MPQPVVKLACILNDGRQEKDLQGLCVCVLACILHSTAGKHLLLSLVLFESPQARIIRIGIAGGYKGVLVGLKLHLCRQKLASQCAGAPRQPKLFVHNTLTLAVL